jgi:hypothetical protein
VTKDAGLPDADVFVAAIGDYGQERPQESRKQFDLWKTGASIQGFSWLSDSST